MRTESCALVYLEGSAKIYVLTFSLSITQQFQSVCNLAFGLIKLLRTNEGIEDHKNTAKSVVGTYIAISWNKMGSMLAKLGSN